MRVLCFFFAAVCFLSGCPPVCEHEPNTNYGDINPQLLGHWEGEARISEADIRPVTIDFYEVGFRFEAWTPDGPFIASGSWGTQIHWESLEISWDRLDLYFQCLEGNPNVSPSWTIWKYYLDEGVLSFHRDTDSRDGEGDPDQDAAYYTLNRVKTTQGG